MSTDTPTVPADFTMDDAHEIIGSDQFNIPTFASSLPVVEVKFIEATFAGMAPDLAATARLEYLKSATPGSAAIDLRYIGETPLVLNPGETQLVPSGLAIWLRDPSFVGMIFPRSGLGNRGLVLGNLTGIIDSDYTGELKISLWNRLQDRETADERGQREVLGDHHPQAIVVEPGERIAQYFAVRRESLAFHVVDEFSGTTDRGEGGFGSSGRI